MPLRWEWPSVFISGDAMMCSLAKEEVPGIVAAAVKEGMGDSTINMHPADACRMIKEYTAAALTLNIPVRTVPDPLVLEINLKHHQTVRAALALPAWNRQMKTPCVILPILREKSM